MQSIEKAKIKEISNNSTPAEAISIFDGMIREHIEPIDELYYHRGNAYRRLGNWKKAIDNYLEAIEINPESPASNAYKMAMEIMEFYDKDMFNQ